MVSDWRVTRLLGKFHKVFVDCAKRVSRSCGLIVEGKYQISTVLVVPCAVHHGVVRKASVPERYCCRIESTGQKKVY